MDGSDDAIDADPFQPRNCSFSLRARVRKRVSVLIHRRCCHDTFFFINLKYFEKKKEQLPTTCRVDDAPFRSPLRNACVPTRRRPCSHASIRLCVVRRRHSEHFAGRCRCAAGRVRSRAAARARCDACRRGRGGAPRGERKRWPRRPAARWRQQCARASTRWRSRCFKSMRRRTRCCCDGSWLRAAVRAGGDGGASAARLGGVRGGAAAAAAARVHACRSAALLVL